MAINKTYLKDLLVTSLDGEWGKDEGNSDFVKMSVIRGTDFPSVRYGDLTTVPTRYIPKRIAKRKTLQEGDILLETAGGSKDRPTGRTLLIKKTILDQREFPITCASFSRFLRINCSIAEPAYIFWYLQFLYETGQMEQHQIQHTGVARFQYTKFASEVKIPIPPIEEQKAIASILSSLDDKIALNHQMNETLEAMARTIFKSWFVDFEPIPGLDPHKGWQDSPIGRIPKGWRVGNIGDIAENIRQGVRPEEITPATPYIGLEHMPRKCIALSEWGHVEDVTSNKFQFQQGNILFGKLRPYFHKVGIAPINGICSTDILVVVPKQPIWYGLLLSHLSSEEFVGHADATSTGTKMPRTNWVNMARYQIAIPPDDIGKSFTEKIEPMIKSIYSNIHQSRILAAIRDALLPKLLSGEIRVKDAELLIGRTI